MIPIEANPAIMNHKVYEARCSSNVNQCKFSDLNGVVLACAG